MSMAGDSRFLEDLGERLQNAETVISGTKVDVGKVQVQVEHLGQMLNQNQKEMMDALRNGFAAVHGRLDAQAREQKSLDSKVLVQDDRVEVLEAAAVVRTTRNKRVTGLLVSLLVVAAGALIKSGVEWALVAFK